MGDLSDIGLKFIQKLGAELNSGKLELPAFPDVALRVRNALEEPDVSADTVARIVSSEPVLTARLLKLANSAMMNPAGIQINDVRTTITRLGFDVVRNSAVSIEMEQLALSESVQHLKDEMKAVWNHSVNVAAMSYVIAKKQTSINPDEAMMVGLLHNIGKIYILTRFENNFPEIAHEQPELMHDLLEKWHSGVGSTILDAWNFSKEISTAVDEYTDAERSHYGPPDLADVVLVANLYDNLSQPGIKLTRVSAIERLHLSPESARQVLAESSDEVNSIMQALGS